MPEVGIRLAAVDGKVVQRELRKFGVEGEQALRRIERASKPARRSLKAVDAAVDDLKVSAAGMSSNLGAAGAGLRAMGPAGAAAAIGIGALALGFTKVVTSSRDAARLIAEIGDAARRAGIDVEAFQELQLVADRNRISVDALTDGIKELNLRADEFIFTGKGPAAEAFQRLGFGAEELKAKLKNPSELLVEIVERLKDFDRAAQIRIADELFGGTAGERFVELIDRGADNIRLIVEESRELGLILEADVVKRAEDLDSELTKAAQTIDRNLKRALLDAAPAAQALSEFLATVLAGFSSLIELTRQVEDQSTVRVQIQLNTLLNERFELLGKIKELETRTQRDSRFEPQLKTARDDLQRIEEDIRRRRDILDRRNGFSETFVYNPETEAGQYQERAFQAEEERKRLEKIADTWIDRITPAADKYQTTLKDIAAAEKEGLLTASQATDARAKAAEDYQKVIDKLNATGNRELEKRLTEVKKLIEASRTPAEELAERLRRIAELESEGLFARAGGNANDARAKAMRDYAAATDDAAAALERLDEIASGNGPSAYAAQLVVAERRTNDLREATEPLREELADGLADAIVNGEELSDVLERLAKQILRDFLSGQFNFLLGGPQPTDFLSRLFSSITGGRFGGGSGGGGGAGSIGTYSPVAASVPGALPAAASAIAPSTGGSVASQIWRYFIGKGLQPHQVAGIVGNVQAESAFNPFAIGDGGNAFGLFQHNDRRNNLFDFIGGRRNLGNVRGQLDFAWHELQTSEGRAFRNLLGSRNVREATAAFGGFERPSGFSFGNPEAMYNWTGRLQAAEEALNVFGGDLNTASSSLTRLDGGLAKAVGSLAEGSGSLASTATDFAGQSKELAGSMTEGLQNVLGGLGDGADGAGSGGFGGLFSGIFKALGGFFGFSRGGSTGPGSDSDVAGVVHANEYVFSAPATRRIGVGVLDALHNNTLKGFQSGGYVAPHASTGGMSAVRRSAANDGRVKIEMHNYSGAQVEVEEEKDDRGGRNIRFIVSEQVADALTTPGGAAPRTLKRTYGIKKQRVNR